MCNGFDYNLSCCSLNQFVIVTVLEELSHTSAALYCTNSQRKRYFLLPNGLYPWVILLLVYYLGLICAEWCGLICVYSNILRPAQDRVVTVTVTPMPTAAPEHSSSVCSVLALAGPRATAQPLLWPTSHSTALQCCLDTAFCIFQKRVLSEARLLHLFLPCPLGCCASSCWLK